jgi:5-methylcytosine-specific restriction endonuclease McrA
MTTFASEEERDQWNAHVAEFLTPRYRMRRAVNTQNRRCRALGVPGTLTVNDWKATCEHHNHLCANCGQEKPLAIDHIIAISKGGMNTAENIQPLCRSCNSRKSNY